MSPAPIRSSTATAPTPTTGRRDLYDARLFREEIFLPVVQEVGEQLASLDIDEWSLPDPDGRLGATAA